MLTRKMTTEIEKMIKELSAKIEEQRLQIIALEGTPSPAVQVQNVARFDKFSVPDPIKLIPTYAGEPQILSSWIESVDQKLQYSKTLINNPTTVDEVMPLWVGIIRDKIIKEGNEVLIRNQTQLDWNCIKKALKEELGDKRDLATLSTKISTLKQGSQDLIAYYQQCKKLLADINANLLANDDTKACVNVLMVNYEAMITNAFIDGLPDSLSFLVRIYKPKNLQEAYEGASEQLVISQKRREKYIQNTSRTSKPQYIQSAPKPPLNQQASGPHYNQPSRPQYNNSTYRPQYNQPSRPQYNNSTNRPHYTQNTSYQNAPSGLPAIQNIKPDPSGQRSQGNSRFPSGQYRNPTQQRQQNNVNYHEASEPDSNSPQESQSNYEDEHKEIKQEQNEGDISNYEVSEENLNFLLGLHPQNEE